MINIVYANALTMSKAIICISYYEQKYAVQEKIADSIINRIDYIFQSETMPSSPLLSLGSR